MDKLIDYIDEELEDLEKKAAKGKLSAAEVQYGDMLAHFKKNMLTADAMEGGYSGTYYRDHGRSYARRDSMGRYSRRHSRDDGYSTAVDGMIEQLHDMMHDAPDADTKNEIQRLITRFEKM